MPSPTCLPCTFGIEGFAAKGFRAYSFLPIIEKQVEKSMMHEMGSGLNDIKPVCKAGP